VTSPVVLELLTKGDIFDEALINAQDALAAVIEVYDDLGWFPLPNAICRFSEKT
jgi:antitoxin HicB